MGQSLSSYINCFRFQKNYTIIATCPYCNIHYGRHLTNHLHECPLKKVHTSIDRFQPGTNLRYKKPN